MNVRDLIKAIGDTDPQFFEQGASRRSLVHRFASKASALTIPLVVSAFLPKAEAKTTSKIGEGFSLALRITHLQRGLYEMGLNASGLTIKPSDRAALEKILSIKHARIELFTQLIDQIGEDQPLIPVIDYTGGYGAGTGPFQKVFQDFEQFLNLAQCLEDVSVRAYKGQISIFMVHSDFMQTLLRAHSSEARIAAKVRMMRRDLPGSTPLLEPWVRGDQSHLPDVFFENFYSGEANTTQMGFAIPGINGMPVNHHAATEAFDEPLPADRVMAVVQKFFAG